MDLASNKIYKALAVYSLLLVIVGTIGNIFTCCICLRKNLRKTTFFVYLSFIAIIDIFTLYTWNLSNFIVPFYGYFHENRHIFWCKLSVFLQFFSLQSSAWLLVTMTIERYLSLIIRKWYSCYFNGRRAAFTSCLIITLSFLFNGHLLIANGHFISINNQTRLRCYEGPYYRLFPMWQTVHGYIYSVVPFTLLFVFNLLLIHKTLNQSSVSVASSSKNLSKKKSMSFTIVLITFSFICFTLPYAVAGGYYFFDLYRTISGRIILFCCANLSFSYHSFNFIVCSIINKKFRSELKELFFGIQSIGSTHATVTQKY